MIGEFCALLVDPIVEALGEKVDVVLGGPPAVPAIPGIAIRLHVRAKGYGGLSILAIDAFNISRKGADKLIDQAVDAVRVELLRVEKAAQEGECRPRVWGLRLGETSVSRDAASKAMIVSARIRFEWEADAHAALL